MSASADQAVLVVDDEPVIRSMVSAMLRDSRYALAFASSAEEALGSLRTRPFRAVLSDLRLPDESGMIVVSEAARACVPVIMMTGYPSVDSAVASMRAGVCDYIRKPFTRLELIQALESAVARRETPAPETGTPAPVAPAFDLVGSSPIMQELRLRIDRAATSDANVLVTGESGTGKELVARRIHQRSRRSGGPFVAVDCTAIPDGLLESELFGHVRGAFTGAVEAKSGLFEAASGGTLFLDEIGDMDPKMQAKLLRAVNDREIRPVGATRAMRTDARIVAATNRGLGKLMEEGAFRPDLFFRLNVIPIETPSLRERAEDVPELVEHFLERSDSGGTEVESETLAALMRMPWPGNVRELRNVIERVLVLGDGHRITPDDLCLSADPSGDRGWDRALGEMIGQRLSLQEIEDLAITAALRAVGGNKAGAARLLGISVRTLHRRRPRARA